MQGLYARLRGIGLQTPYVRKFLLPDWWDDLAAETPAGFTEAVWTVARHLGVQPDQLREHKEPLRLPHGARVQYKLAANTQPEAVALARVLGEQVARFALLGAPSATGAGSTDASSIRSRILETGVPWVGFGALLDDCWNAGIPVLHVSEFPAGAAKMDGLAVNIAGRPAIVLCSRRRHAAWQLFVLAHELGHVACGHVDTDVTLVDGEVDEDSTDPQEQAANAFAIELITGKPDTKVVPKARWPKADELAAVATQLGQRLAVDPGHIVLNYDPVAMVRERMSSRLDWAKLPAEAAEFVARMTGLDTESPRLLAAP